MITDDTIAAISTPIGVGGISVIRVSGVNSFSIAERLLGISLAETKSHTVHYNQLRDPITLEIIDAVLVTVFRAPSSYTGLDTIEFSCHGGILNSKRIMEILVQEGARLAEPGEFTKLAYINGKLDLAQVEAVADLIHSRTESARRSSAAQFMGNLSSFIKSLRVELVGLCSLLEIDLDFAEENLINIDRRSITERIQAVARKIQGLLDTYQFGHLVRDGAKIAIVGKPNVGKSSLLNIMLKKDRALVSETPGTTRDYIEESIDISGIPFTLVDTAGIRNSEDAVENMGIIFSKELLNNSDLVLALFDQSAKFDMQDESVINLLKEVRAPVLFVINKIDAGSRDFTESNLQPHSHMRISAKTGEGISELRARIFSMFSTSASYDSPVISRTRHKAALEKSLRSLSTAIESVDRGMSFEFVAVDVRNAISSLGEIIGEITSDDILNNIFSSFCIGK